MRTLIALLLLLAVATLVLLNSRPAVHELPRAPLADAALAGASHEAPGSNTLALNSRVAPTHRESLAREDASSSSKDVDPLNATLVVRARRKSSHAPIAGVEIKLWPSPGAHPISSSQLDFSPPLDAGRTDSLGNTTLRAPASVPLLLDATAPDGTLGGVGVMLDALTTGERKELDVELPERDDARVFGLVLALETGAPITNARVELRDERGASIAGHPACTTGADGRFEFVFTSWDRQHLRIEADGSGARLADPTGHGEPARMLLVKLAKTCTLKVLARDAARAPVEGVRIRLTALGDALGLAASEGSGFFMREYLPAPEETWSAETGSDGRATLAGLPAEVELRSEVAWRAVRTHLEPERFTLAPGEARELALLVGGGTRIVGVALDQDGKPLIAQGICLAECDTDPQRRTLLLESPQVRARAITGKDGRFAFDAVEPGCWIVVPSRTAGSGQDVIAALPERVETAGEPVHEVTLHAFRGLALCGTVLDPDGNPVADARVEAYAEGELFWGDARSGADGRFRLGPVTTDVLTLLAYGRSGLANSDPRAARPNDEGLVLRLKRGGTLRGRVVDGGSGAACVAQLLFAPEQRGFGPFGSGAMLSTEADGSFEIHGLEAGGYRLCAMSADGRFAQHIGVAVGAGSDTGGLEFALMPGGKLALRHTGKEAGLHATITWAGVPVHFGSLLEPGRTVTMLAPAGSLVLELRPGYTGPVRRIRLELQAGETKTVEIQDT